MSLKQKELEELKAEADALMRKIDDFQIAIIRQISTSIDEEIIEHACRVELHLGKIFSLSSRALRGS